MMIDEALCNSWGWVHRKGFIIKGMRVLWCADLHASREADIQKKQFASLKTEMQMSGP